MTPFPPFGGGQVPTGGGVAAKLQTTSANNAGVGANGQATSANNADNGLL